MKTGRSRTPTLAAVPAVVAAALAAIVLLLPSMAWAADGGSDTGAFQRALAHGAIVALAASYVFGLATSLTPCVYPMIAITVSVFGAKEAKGRLHGMLLSLTFVLGIVALFTPMGVASALTGKGFGSALGNPWVVAAIAVVFLSLSASLFGAFEIALPASLNNRLSGVGGAGLPRRVRARARLRPRRGAVRGAVPLRPARRGSRRRATWRSARRRWRSTASASERSSSSSAPSP